MTMTTQIETEKEDGEKDKINSACNENPSKTSSPGKHHEIEEEKTLKHNKSEKIYFASKISSMADDTKAENDIEGDDANRSCAVDTEDSNTAKADEQSGNVVEDAPTADEPKMTERECATKRPHSDEGNENEVTKRIRKSLETAATEIEASKETADDIEKPEIFHATELDSRAQSSSTIREKTSGSATKTKEEPQQQYSPSSDIQSGDQCSPANHGYHHQHLQNYAYAHQSYMPHHGHMPPGYSPPNYRQHQGLQGIFPGPYSYHPMYNTFVGPPHSSQGLNAGNNSAGQSPGSGKGQKKKDNKFTKAADDDVENRDKTEEKAKETTDFGEDSKAHVSAMYQQQQMYCPSSQPGMGFPNIQGNASGMMYPSMFMGQGAYPSGRQHLSPPFASSAFMTGHYGMTGPMQIAPPPHMQSTGGLRHGISLSLACDVEQLSDYQIMVRQQLEIFEAGPEDVESNTQGRKKPVVRGQVGLRCRHCAAFPLRARGRGAVYYPAKLQGIYQAAQNMAGSHLCQACQHIPAHLKEEIRKLRDRRDNASGGKQYWADGCRALGIYETEQGLKLGKAPMSGMVAGREL